MPRVAPLLQLVRGLWRDTRGDAGPIGLILTTVLVAIGVIVGLVIVRDAVVQEFGDLAVALDSLNHSYSFQVAVDTDCDTTNGFEYNWSIEYFDDFGQVPTVLDDLAGSAPACLDLNGGTLAEGDPLPPVTGTLP